MATNLRRLRNAKGLTQEALAERAQVNCNYVGMIEGEKNSPTIKMLERLAEALEVDPQEFFARPGKSSPAGD